MNFQAFLLLFFIIFQEFHEFSPAFFFDPYLFFFDHQILFFVDPGCVFFLSSKFP